MPPTVWLAACLHTRNHPAWENYPAALAALSPAIVSWLASGKLEYVLPGYVEPVPKTSAPLYRLITDGRLGKQMFSDWAAVYLTICNVILGLAPFHHFFSSASTLQTLRLDTIAFGGCGQDVLTVPTTWIQVQVDSQGLPEIQM
jgi:hypothetical protein